MFRKFYIPISIAVLAAIVVGAVLAPVAFAQGGQPAPLPRGRLGRLGGALRLLGQVTAVSDQTLSIQTRQGKERAFSLDAQTRYQLLDGAEMALSDVKAGEWVAVAAGPLARLRGGEAPAARAVIILPAGFNPDELRPVRGHVVSVNPSANTLTLQDRQGTQSTIVVDAKTHYTGLINNLAEIKPGMLAQAMVEAQPGGELLAITVRSGYLPERRIGQITAVDAAEGTFTLQTAFSGQTLTIQVDSQTRFRSKGNTITSLADLQPGMFAAVTATEAEGALTARLVAAGNGENLRQVEQRVAGQVTGVSGNTFTVQARDGQSYTFTVSAGTRFHSRGGSVQSIAGLQAGMTVLVGASGVSSGQPEAVVVWVVRVGR